MHIRTLVGIVFAGFVLAAAAAAAQEAPSVEELRARVAENPESGGDWYALGRALQDLKQYDPALEAFRRAAELRFQAGGAWMRSAQILAAKGDTAGALRELERAAESAPAVLSLLPQVGGIPELEGDARLARLLERAERARHPCLARPESRQLDFWLGRWTVSNPQGQTVGENVVTVDLAGCVVRESWTDGYGNRGTSVNFYDPATAVWHQIWTSDDGTVTHYQGEWRDGAMRFAAGGFGDADGVTGHRRMTFTPNPDGSVRQLIEQSEDGTVWTLGFDGLYRPMRAAD